MSVPRILAMALAFGRAGNSGWRISPTALAERGTAAARVYVDVDNDGQFGDGDRPLSEALIRVDGRRSYSATDAQGMVLVGNLPIYRPITVSVDLSTLDDPMLQPSSPTNRLMLRPGATANPFPRTLRHRRS